MTQYKFKNLLFIFSNIIQMIQDLSTSQQATVQDVSKGPHIHPTSKTQQQYFQTVLFSKLGLKQPILSDAFKTSEKKIVYLLLFPSCLVVTAKEPVEPESYVKTLQFSFDTSFFISLKKPNDGKKYCSLKIVSIQDKRSESFHSEDNKVINKWAAILINYINQIGIQEYYKTIRHLGKGVSADVYLAERILDGKQFAIKVFNKTKNNQKCLNAFISQLKIMRLLNHPNIIKLYGVFASKEFVYAILQYLSGGNLYEQIKNKKRFTKQEQFVILKHLSEGVEHLRQKRIVHRDLKLQNILVRKTVQNNSQYVICDFGLATWLDEQSYIFQKCGTPGYIAPQILRFPKEEKLLLTNKADIYSLGSIFHVILLLRPVFIYEGDFKVLLKLNKKSEINWSQPFYNHIPQQQLRMLQSMLQSNPDKRISSQTLLKLDYFKKQRSNIYKISQNVTFKAQTSKTQNLQSLVVGSSKILRNTDKSGTSKVKQQRQTSLNRNSSLTKQIKFDRKNSEQSINNNSSIFDIFRRKKSSTGMNHTDMLSPKREQVKSLVSMSATTIQQRTKSTQRKGSIFGLLFNRSQT